MTKLINLNQTVFVPVVDESKGGVEYEIQMTLAEFFKKCLHDFEPEIVDAIPMEWLEWRINHAEREGFVEVAKMLRTVSDWWNDQKDLWCEEMEQDKS